MRRRRDLIDCSSRGPTAEAAGAYVPLTGSTIDIEHRNGDNRSSSERKPMQALYQSSLETGGPSDQDQLEQALAALSRAQSLNPNDRDARRRLAEVYRRLHKFAEAEAQYETLMQLELNQWANVIHLVAFYLAANCGTLP